jgi:hypothetical protein
MTEAFRTTETAAARRTPQAGRAAAPIISVCPDPAIWATALRLCGNDVHRVEVLDASLVIVHNNSSRRAAARRGNARQAGKQATT